MNCRKLEITVHSAEDLEKVRKNHKMKVYAAVTIAGDQGTVQYTPPDKSKDINPAWNHTLKYNIGENSVSQNGVMLVLKLYCKVSIGKDRYFGEISASLDELFARSQDNRTSSLTTSYPVKRGSKVSQGSVTFSCRFGKTYVRKKPPFWMKAGRFIVGAMVTTAIGIPVPSCFYGSNER